MSDEQSYQQNTLMKLQLASQLRAEGHYDEAVLLIKSAIVDDPGCAPAYNSLGTLYYQQKEFDAAIDAYQAALDVKPDFLDAYYNLGLAQARSGRESAAIVTFRALLSLLPEHMGARFQVGCLLMQRQDYLAASQEFDLLLKQYPDHFESMANLALCYLQTGRLDLAAKCYWQALEMTPDDQDILFNLGVIHMQQGYTQDGIAYYQRAVKVSPDYFDAHHNLAAAYLMCRDYEQATYHFQEALRLQPENAALRHTLQILKQDKQLDGSAPAYIRSLFDSYASYYEPHLLTHLQYQVPEKLHEAMLSVIKPAPGDVLDLGCGTGLCAPLFKPYASHLVGVDLSPNMLAIAEQKNIYDELVAADVVQYLEQHPVSYQLLVAADVLVYFGELSVLMCAAANALSEGGYLVFNVEIGTEHDFVLTLSGRFAHSKSYLDALAEKNSFTVIKMEEAILRYQDKQPVMGYLCVWAKA